MLTQAPGLSEGWCLPPALLPSGSQARQPASRRSAHRSWLQPALHPKMAREFPGDPTPCVWSESRSTVYRTQPLFCGRRPRQGAVGQLTFTSGGRRVLPMPLSHTPPSPEILVQVLMSPFVPTEQHVSFLVPGSRPMSPRISVLSSRKGSTASAPLHVPDPRTPGICPMDGPNPPVRG